MDMVAVYLDVDFTISLKDIVALLQPLQLVFDAVREFVIYVPRGREIVLRVGLLTITQLTTDVLMYLSFPLRDNHRRAGRATSSPRTIIRVSY